MRGSAQELMVVDDDDLFVEFATAVLEEAGYRTVSAANGNDALVVARAHLPLVVLLDIQLPGLNGYEVCRMLRAAYGRALGIAFVSGTRTDAIDVSAGLLVGADDYLVKPCDPEMLVARIGALARRVDANRPTEAAGRKGLTGRETEVLGLLSDGLGQRDIAVTLSISQKTVAVHIEHILEKLSVHSRTQAVAAAYRHGLLEPLAPPSPVTA